MGYLFSLILSLLAHVSSQEDPFTDIRAVHQNFEAMLTCHDEYVVALAKVAPIYDLHRRPGPPSDMYYHLELIDRIKNNITSLLREMSSEWEELGLHSTKINETKH